MIGIIREKLIKQKRKLPKVTWRDEEINNGVAPRIKFLKAQGFEVYYEDNEHLYFVVTPYGRFPLISVTTVIGLFKEPFDSKGMSLRCAGKNVYDTNCLNKEGWDSLSISEKALRISTAWSENSKEASYYGTVAHACCEHYAVHRKEPDYAEIKQRYGDRAFEMGPIPTFVQNVAGIINGFIKTGWECLPEPVLVDMEVGVSGQSDLVMLNHVSKKIWVLDYKTNTNKPKEHAHAFNNMLGYFSDFKDNDYTHYCIQLAYYAIMLKEQYTGYEVEGLTIIWLNRETGQCELVPIDFLIWEPIVQGMREYLIVDQGIKEIYAELVHI